MLSSPYSEANGQHRRQPHEEPPAPARRRTLRAVGNDVRHRLPLSALTQVRLSHAPTMEAGTAGTRGLSVSRTGSEGSTVDEVDQSQVVGRQGQALGYG